MLTINRLSFGYRKQAVILKEIDLDLKPGHIYGLLGKNGAGKSTLLKNMVGLAAPIAGQCLFNGTIVTGRPVPVLEDLFFIPDEIFLPALTPRQFVQHTGSFYPRFNESDFFNYLQLLDVDQQDIMDKQSYGQQKKMIIAFGLAAHTSLLVMDEPTNGLDIPSKMQFRKLVASIQDEERCMVISTHQVRDLDSLIDTVLLLHDGRMIVNQPVDAIAEKLYFGVYDDTSSLPILYEEENMRGKNAILLNTKNAYSRPDIELLFNAIVSGHTNIVSILNVSGQ